MKIEYVLELEERPKYVSLFRDNRSVYTMTINPAEALRFKTIKEAAEWADEQKHLFEEGQKVIIRFVGIGEVNKNA